MKITAGFFVESFVNIVRHRNKAADLDHDYSMFKAFGYTGPWYNVIARIRFSKEVKRRYTSLQQNKLILQAEYQLKLAKITDKYKQL
jgi:hypothetical protein